MVRGSGFPDLMRDTGFAPSTPIEEGIRGFVAWYHEHYRI
jgi:UDP-glucuronate 4-epimerase